MVLKWFCTSSSYNPMLSTPAPLSPRLLCCSADVSGEDWADFPLPSIYTSDKVLLTPQNVDYEAALVTGIHWAGRLDWDLEKAFLSCWMLLVIGRWWSNSETVATNLNGFARCYNRIRWIMQIVNSSSWFQLWKIPENIPKNGWLRHVLTSPFRRTATQARYRKTADMTVTGEWMQSFVARASFNLGFMHQFGIGIPQVGNVGFRPKSPWPLVISYILALVLSRISS